MTTEEVDTPSLEIRTIVQLEEYLSFLQGLIAEDVRCLRADGYASPLLVDGEQHCHVAIMAFTRDVWRDEGRDLDAYLVSAKAQIAAWQATYKGEAA